MESQRLVTLYRPAVILRLWMFQSKIIPATADMLALGNGTLRADPLV